MFHTVADFKDARPLPSPNPIGSPPMRYIPLLRPASHATLPDALQWSYVEAPAYITGRPDLPRSRHPHGLIETARPLTPEEIERFSLRPA